jgi:hypothetical protein
VGEKRNFAKTSFKFEVFYAQVLKLAPGLVLKAYAGIGVVIFHLVTLKPVFAISSLTKHFSPFTGY